MSCHDHSESDCNFDKARGRPQQSEVTTATAEAASEHEEAYTTMSTYRFRRRQLIRSWCLPRGLEIHPRLDHKHDGEEFITLAQGVDVQCSHTIPVVSYRCCRGQWYQKRGAQSWYNSRGPDDQPLKTSTMDTLSTTYVWRAESVHVELPETSSAQCRAELANLPSIVSTRQNTTSPSDVTNSNAPSHPSHHQVINLHHNHIAVKDFLVHTRSQCAPRPRHPKAPSLLFNSTAHVAATSNSTPNRLPSSAAILTAITSRVAPSASSRKCTTVASR